jgi:hypothetical protein
VAWLEQVAGDILLHYTSNNRSLHHIVEADPSYADPALASIVAAARHLLQPDVAASVARRLHVWRSKQDGSWQVWQVTLPLGYTPDRKWPLEIYFHPAYKELEEASYIHQVVGAITGTALQFQGDRPIQFQGDRIRLSLFGRGNSFEELGDEEFQEALNYGLQTLSGDQRSVILAGPSDGATDALVFAERYPDQVCHGSVQNQPLRVDIGQFKTSHSERWLVS